MLTAKGETQDKVQGFHLGTDDYLVKPFDPWQLIVRVKALLKRYRIATSQTVQVGRLAMDRKTFEVKADEENFAHYRSRNLNCSFKLASYPGKTLSRDQLIRRFGATTSAATSVLWTYTLTVCANAFPLTATGSRSGRSEAWGIASRWMY